MSILLPTISTLFIMISAVLVGIGWHHIRKGRRETHQKFMTFGAVFALAFFIIYSSRTLLAGNATFGGPEHLKMYYLIFLFFHITLATVAGIFGLVTLVLAYRKNFDKHRKIGRWTATMWLVTAPTGFMVYLLLYIIYPSGEIKPLVDAVFGF